jgi:hypothetical protein
MVILIRVKGKDINCPDFCGTKPQVMKQLSVFLLALLFPFFGISQTQTQTITGSVYDEASKAPLISVIVTVLNTSPDKGTATDSNGRFRITGVPIGRRSFKASYLSYETRIISDIEVTAGKETNLTIGMQEEVRKLSEVTVSYNRSKDKNQTINDMALISARSFNVDETKRYAGSLGDPSRMAANFAGIVAGNDSRNDIVVRGNSPTGMLWNIEGLNAPNPNHFGALNSTGGPVSMLNNNNIDKSDFLTGAFPAQYGNARAGVFDIRLRNGNMDKAEYVAQVGFNGFEGGAEGPIGKNKRTSYLINYRYSTLGVFKALGLNLGTGTAVPVYQDVNYKLVSQLSKKSRLAVFGIAGNSHVDFLGKDVDTSMRDLFTSGDPFSNIHTKYAGTITGASYDYQISERSSTKFIAGYCTTYEYFSNDSISNLDGSTYPHHSATFKTGKLSLIWTYVHKFNAKNNIQAGVQYDNTAFNLVNKRMFSGQPITVYVDQVGNIGLSQSYLQWKHRFNKELSFVGGMHFQFLDLNNSFAAEPRMGFRYAIDSRNSVNLGYGMHNQAQSVYSYFVQTHDAGGTSYTNKNLGFTQSQHLMAGYGLNVSENMRVKVEAYYQYMNKVPVTLFPSSYSSLNEGVSFSPPTQDSLTNKGTGYNYGAEITVEHFLTKGFYFLVTGSLINSRYEGSDGVERNTAFHTGYVLNVLAGKEFKVGNGNVLALNFKVANIGGRYLTPLDVAASEAEGDEVYQDNLAFSVRQSPYFRSDFKISFRKEYKRSTLEFSLDLQNITNHKNIFGQIYDKKTNRIVSNYQQGFFPVPLLRYTF